MINQNKNNLKMNKMISGLTSAMATTGSTSKSRQMKMIYYTIYKFGSIPTPTKLTSSPFSVKWHKNKRITETV